MIMPKNTIASRVNEKVDICIWLRVCGAGGENCINLTNNELWYHQWSDRHPIISISRVLRNTLKELGENTYRALLTGEKQ
jgi:hypothetical protein